MKLNLRWKCLSCKHDSIYTCARGYLKRNAEYCRYYEKRHVYICGKVTGDPDYRKKFKEEEDRLLSLDFIPVNPASFIAQDEEWTKAMRIAVRAMLLCDGLSLLPDWKKSKGAKIEVRLARELALDVRDSDKWV